jgi:thiamine pyrophosphate-dependent acetolactate synthase large subunit-like protein
MIRDAKRPILFAGQGVVMSGPGEVFREFVEKTDIPVAAARCWAWAASRPRTRATSA